MKRVRRISIVPQRSNQIRVRSVPASPKTFESQVRLRQCDQCLGIDARRTDPGSAIRLRSNSYGIRKGDRTPFALTHTVLLVDLQGKAPEVGRLGLFTLLALADQPLRFMNRRREVDFQRMGNPKERCQTGHMLTGFQH